MSKSGLSATRTPPLASKSKGPASAGPFAFVSCSLFRGPSYCPTGGGAGAFFGVDKYPAIWFFELIEFTTISYSPGSLPL